MLLTACSEDKPQQQVKQIAEQYQETPSSLSGEELHMGPNPHSTLSRVMLFISGVLSHHFKPLTVKIKCRLTTSAYRRNN